MSIPLPPTPPSITDPENFAERADAFNDWLANTFVPQLNTIIGATIPAGSAAAGTLTGDTIASNVTKSSLTQVGTLTGVGAASALNLSSSAGSVGTLTVTDTSGSAGVNIKMKGNGASTPDKYVRVAGGIWQVTNDAYSAVLLSVTDAGAVTALTTLTGTTGVIGCVFPGTEQATTSGVSIDFTGIPTGTKRITVNFKGVSGNGTSNFLLQLGDSGGVENTGYLSNAINYGTSIVQSSIGFVVTGANSGTATLLGKVVIDLENAAAFSWTATGNLFDSTNNLHYMSAGSKSLSAELDRVRITFVNGTDAFDLGAINISYER